MSAFLAIVVLLGYIFAESYGNINILYFFIILSVVMNISSYYFSDKIALSVSGAKEADPIIYKDLHNIVENLSITAGLPKPKVYIVEDISPNAFATGRDKNHSAVAVTTGLLSILDKSELEGVIAHELSHIGNRDILIGTVIVVLVGLIAIMSDFFIRSQLFGGRGRNSDSKAGNILVIVGVIFAILSPIISTIIQLAISRKREYLADASGALLTRYPEGLANALQKINEHSMPMKKASNATAHLFIANPFGGLKKGVSNLFMTHPPVESRIKALLNK